MLLPRSVFGIVANSSAARDCLWQHDSLRERDAASTEPGSISARPSSLLVLTCIGKKRQMDSVRSASSTKLPA